MREDKLPQDEEISNDELEQVNGGIGIINQNPGALKFDKAIKFNPVSTNILKVENSCKI